MESVQVLLSLCLAPWQAPAPSRVTQHLHLHQVPQSCSEQTSSKLHTALDHNSKFQFQYLIS